jgi:hypothetical protein
VRDLSEGYPSVGKLFFSAAEKCEGNSLEGMPLEGCR